MQITTKKLPKSEVEISGELPTEHFETYFQKALANIGAHIEMDGFRKGKVPENILLSRVPEMSILEEMASLAISEHYPKILMDEKIDAISRPEITITKLVRNNPLGFIIKTAVLPEVKLPDYKKIAAKINMEMKDEEKDLAVTDEEFEKTLLDIRKSRSPQNKDADGKPKEVEEKDIVELNDEFVQALGPFTNVEDFKEKLRANIKLEKENQLKEKNRLKTIEKIIDETEADLPEILIEVELDKIMHRMESDITQMGLKFEDYLVHLKKTREEIRKDFRGDGEKKAKLSLVLHKISETENIKADEEQVNHEVEHILEHYKDADPERARAHAENVLTNEKVFNFLESQK